MKFGTLAVQGMNFHFFDKSDVDFHNFGLFDRSDKINLINNKLNISLINVLPSAPPCRARLVLVGTPLLRETSSEAENWRAYSSWT